MVQNVFHRYEKKYLIDPNTYEAFKKDLDEYMTEDAFGWHTIRNLYYDTTDSQLIRTSIEKPKYKEKFRVRCYGQPTEDSQCFLEIKKKYKGLVNKRRIAMSIPEARRYLVLGHRPERQDQIFQEIEYFMQHYEIVPMRYIAYDRLALFGKEDKEFRVTFDRNIRSRTENLTLFSDDNTELLLEPGYCLMEVKVAGAMPLWFVHLLSKYEIYNTSFSKYGRFYSEEVLNNTEEKEREEV